VIPEDKRGSFLDEVRECLVWDRAYRERAARQKGKLAKPSDDSSAEKVKRHAQAVREAFAARLSSAGSVTHATNRPQEERQNEPRTAGIRRPRGPPSVLLMLDVAVSGVGIMIRGREIGIGAGLPPEHHAL
jgi:hypothetical protein